MSTQHYEDLKEAIKMGLKKHADKDNGIFGPSEISFAIPIYEMDNAVEFVLNEIIEKIS
jgi:hypothetical protein